MGWSHSTAMIESKWVLNSKQYVATYINVTCVMSTRKKYATCTYPDFTSTYFPSRFINNATLADTRVMWGFFCQRYTCYVYARRDTLFWPTGLNHGRGAIWKYGQRLRMPVHFILDNCPWQDVLLLLVCSFIRLWRNQSGIKCVATTMKRLPFKNLWIERKELPSKTIIYSFVS